MVIIDLYFPLCLFFGPWINWQKCPWKLRTGREKLQKVPFKNKTCPWAFSEIQHFWQFSQTKQGICDFRSWNRNIFFPWKKGQDGFRRHFWFSRKKQKQKITVWVIISTINFMLSPPSPPICFFSDYKENEKYFLMASIYPTG